MTDLSGLMQQVQQMQEKMKDAQAEQAKREVTGESGAGLVKVTLNGRYEALKVELDSSLMSEDKEVVEDLLAAAINAASRKVVDSSSNNMSDMLSGVEMPEGFEFPFK